MNPRSPSPRRSNARPMRGAQTRPAAVSSTPWLVRREKTRSKADFEAGNRLGHGRLGQMHEARGRAERAYLHHGVQRREVTDIRQRLHALFPDVYTFSYTIGQYAIGSALDFASTLASSRGTGGLDERRLHSNRAAGARGCRRPGCVGCRHGPRGPRPDGIAGSGIASHLRRRSDSRPRCDGQRRALRQLDDSRCRGTVPGR